MNTFELKIFNDELPACTIYTVIRHGETDTEARKFFAKHLADPKCRAATKDLINWISEVIGEDGALPELIRSEDAAHAIPQKGERYVGGQWIDFTSLKVRVYCLRLTNDVLILFNGGEKTHQTARGGKTKGSFDDAQLFAEPIWKAYTEGILYVEEGRICNIYDDDPIKFSY